MSLGDQAITERTLLGGVHARAATVAEALQSWAERFLRWVGALSAGRVAVIAGLAALVLMTLYSLASIYWSTSNGAQGPIIFVSAVWLFWREREDLRLRPGSISGVWLAAFVPALVVLYIYAAVFRVLTLQSAALYALLVVLAFYYWGPRIVRQQWFAILYLGFLVRPPAGLTAELTQPLKMWISSTSASLLYAAGYPIATAGVRLQVAQYELLVQQACAGLGSIFSLLAICVLYIQLVRRSDPLRNALLLFGAIPVAVGANLLRVLLLILITFYFGNRVAQGFTHQVAGLMTFVLSLLGMAALDRFLGLFASRRSSHG